MAFANTKQINNLIKSIIEGNLDEFDVEEPKFKGLISKKIASLGKRLKSRRESISSVFKGLFTLATQISSFDIKLKFYSEKINSDTKELALIASDVYSIFEEATAAVTQVTEGSSELSSSLENITEESKILNDNTVKSNEMIKEIEEESKEVVKYSKDMNQDINYLFNTLEKMRETLSGIHSISNQTNLLALNASIEAARAGDSGKGFMVVAEEIRKLSDTTKSLLKSMDELLDEVNTASVKSKESVEKTIYSIERANASMSMMSQVLRSNASSIDKVTQNLTNISAFNEELNASLEEVTAGMNNISEDAEKVSYLATDLELLGQNILHIADDMKNIEEEVDALTKQGGEIAVDKLHGLSNNDFIASIESAIYAHIKWVENLMDMVQKGTPQPLQINEQRCGFGHFYYSVKPTSDIILPLWKEVEDHHSELHKKGGIAIELLENGDKHKAAQVAEEVDIESKIIIGLFNKMLAATKEIGDRGQRVF